MNSNGVTPGREGVKLLALSAAEQPRLSPPCPGAYRRRIVVVDPTMDGRTSMVPSFLALLATLALAEAPPVRHSSGRELPPMPEITAPVLFNTPEANRILAALQVFPADNPWNEPIAHRPLHPRSQAIIASVGPDKRLAYNLDMGFVLVPSDQPKVPVQITLYPKESDKGPFPVPDNAPVEEWPLNGRRLEDWQRAE